MIINVVTEMRGKDALLVRRKVSLVISESSSIVLGVGVGVGGYYKLKIIGFRCGSFWNVFKRINVSLLSRYLYI